MATETAMRATFDALLEACAQPRTERRNDMRARRDVYPSLPPSLCYLAAYAFAVALKPPCLEGLFQGENDLYRWVGFPEQSSREGEPSDSDAEAPQPEPYLHPTLEDQVAAWHFLSQPFSSVAFAQQRTTHGFTFRTARLPEAVLRPLLFGVCIVLGESLPLEIRSGDAPFDETDHILDPIIRCPGAWAREPACLSAAVTYVIRLLIDRETYYMDETNVAYLPKAAGRWAFETLWDLLETWPATAGPSETEFGTVWAFGDLAVPLMLADCHRLPRGDTGPGYLRRAHVRQTLADWEPTVSQVGAFAPRLFHETEYWTHMLEREGASI